MDSGKLIKWNDDKGFGFIQIEGKANNVFIHISTLKHMNRAPKVGDVIFFDIQKQADGKLRAENCRIQGVKLKDYKSTNKNSEQTIWLKILGTLLAFCVVAAAVFFIKIAIDVNKPVKYERHKVAPPINSLFKCKGKRHCSQMISCDEANFYMKYCPNTILDGDDDDIPCEDKLCGHGW